MLVVVPSHEPTNEIVPVFKRSESIGKFGVVFQRTKLGFRERVIIANVRAAVRTYDTELVHQGAHRLRRHLCAAIGMNDCLAGFDTLTFQRLLDEMPCELGVSSTPSIQPTTNRLNMSSITSNENHTPGCGPRSLVISHEKT